MEKIKEIKILKIEKGEGLEHLDLIVIEEPLEIQVQYFFKKKWLKKSLAITMRTPGNDEVLAIGFLFSEGLIGNWKDIDSIKRIEDNILIIKLIKGIKFEIDLLERHFYTTSSCGICGKASIEKIEKITCFFPRPKLPKISTSTIQALPEVIRNTQTVFDQTGGIHAAGLFNPKGDLMVIQEDIGRHNAVDKLIGTCLKNGEIPLRNHILMLSGRISFELVQKAMMVGIPIIAAVGAPSSLAIELAQVADITVIGFLRGERYNVYCGKERLVKDV